MYDRTNTFTLSRNKDKDQEGANPKWPDHKGRININGEEFWLSAWVQTNKETGEKFFSGKIGEKVKPKGEKQERSSGGALDPDDEIPFIQHERGSIA